MKFPRIGLLAVVLSSMAAPVFSEPSTKLAEPSDVTAALDRALNKAAPSSARQPGVILSIDAPSIGLAWTGAAGRFDRNKSESLKPDQPFRIASITKVFTAAAIFRLIEDGKLGLSDPIAGHVSKRTTSALHADGYDSSAIRIQHLLAHTSGLYDYAMDPGFVEAVISPTNKRKRWTRDEQIKLAMDNGKPLGKPGERYGYSDTGYVILGEIIARTSGLAMPAYIRSALGFDAIDLKATYFENLEPVPAGASLPLARQYFGQVDVTDIDASFDLYGGGGLVSTTADLNRFFRALFTGRVFKHPRTLAQALMTVPAAHADGEFPHANLLATTEFGTHGCWGQVGFWGSTALYCPDIDVVLAFTLNESASNEPGGSSARRAQLINDLLATLEPALDAARKPAGAAGK